MQTGKFNVVLDAMWGSSGKGKVSTWLAEHFATTRVSSSNFPNAGHSAVFSDGTKFIAKAIPTAAILKKTHGMGMECFVSPGSGFSWKQMVKEWGEAGRPTLRVHGRASIVTEEHARREREGVESTVHIASTMQGSGTAMVDKLLRREDCKLAQNTEEEMRKAFEGLDVASTVSVMKAEEFRSIVQHAILDQGHTWLHEGSQGYALSIDHGSHYPNCTSRNCTVQAAMDHMAMPPSALGDVYLNLRSYPIRVGHVIGESGELKGHSGGFYPDCRETTWDQVALDAGMPVEEARRLAERERTTVTKRIRRVATFSFTGLRDAVRTNGATKLVMNFIQYVSWEDAGVRGGKEAFLKLSRKSREFLEKVEEAAGVPVVLIGTGASHEDMVSLL